jgi:hypothetical protein
MPASEQRWAYKLTPLAIAVAIGLVCDMTSATEKDREDIAEIRMERTPTFGIVPVDTMVLRSDGTAFDIGERNVERIGCCKGKYGGISFDRLVQLLARARFFEMKQSFAGRASDQASRIITIYGNRGVVLKRVED